MNFKRIGALYRKEMLELVRNTGLLFVLIIFPVILYPLLISYSVETGNSKQEKIRTKINNVAICGGEMLPEISSLLDQERNLKIVSMQKDAALKITNDLPIIINISPKERFFNETNSGYTISLIYDSTNPSSSYLLDRVKTLLDDYKRELVYRELDQKNLSYDLLDPIEISSENQATPKKILGDQLGQMIPILLVMFILTGTLQVSVDLTAGEKERRTIQTLLLTGINGIEILLGKLAAVITCALATTVINMSSIMLTISLLSPNMGVISGFSLPLPDMLIGFCSILPLIFLLGVLLLTLGMLGRNQVEAGLYTTPVMLLCFIPLIMSGADDGSNLYMNFIPVANNALTFKGLLMSNLATQTLTWTIISNSIYAIALFLVASALFRREEIAFGGLSDLFNKRADHEFSLKDSIMLYVLVLIMYPILGQIFRGRDLYRGIIFSQIILILLPTLIMAANCEHKKLFGLNKAAPIAWLLTPIVAAGTVIVANSAGALQLFFFPMPKKLLQDSIEIFTLKPGATISMLLAVAIIPAIVEELLFRGAILNGVQKKFSPIWSILIVGLAFAIFHLDPYIIVSLAITGIILTAWRILSNSIFTVMLLHGLYNILLIYLGNNSKWQLGFVDNPILILISLTVIVISILILKHNRQQTNR